MWFRVGLLSLLALVTPAIASDVEVARPAPNDEYERVIAQRAATIVAKVEIEDQQRAERVARLIADQYRGLSQLHARRDQLAEAASEATDGPSRSDSQAAAALQAIEIEQFALHRQFLAKLAVELQPEQIDRVKDGMTYGVVDGTYARYVQLLPQLSDAEKRQIKAWLLEAREYAMDAGSAEEKHGWFRKYKGRINNFISQQGHDLADAERRLQEQR